MSGFKSLAQLMAHLADGGGYSKHHTARAQRFVFRHPQAHRRIIPELIDAQREHEAAADRRFLAVQRTRVKEVPSKSDWRERVWRGRKKRRG